MPPFGDLRDTLPPRSFFGPVHRVEVAIHEEHLYVTVLVPSCFQEFAGLLSWVNIWCGFNQDNPSCTKGVLFADGPVDSSGWRLSGWVVLRTARPDTVGHRDLRSRQHSSSRPPLSQPQYLTLGRKPSGQYVRATIPVRTIPVRSVGEGCRIGQFAIDVSNPFHYKTAARHPRGVV